MDAAGAGEVATGAAVAFDETGDETAGAPARADDAPWFFGGRAEDGSGGAVGGAFDLAIGGTLGSGFSAIAVSSADSAACNAACEAG